MPLKSDNLQDLTKEYLSNLTSLRSQQVDACNAFGAYSDQEEKYDIKIFRLHQEFQEKTKELSKKKEEE